MKLKLNWTNINSHSGQITHLMSWGRQYFGKDAVVYICGNKRCKFSFERFMKQMKWWVYLMLGYFLSHTMESKLLVVIAVLFLVCSQAVITWISRRFLRT